MFIVQSFKIEYVVLVSFMAQIFYNEEFGKVVLYVGHLRIHFFIELIFDVGAIHLF